MKRARGGLYQDLMAVLVPGVVVSTPQIAAAMRERCALVGVTLCRAAKKGLVVRVDAASGTQIGRRAALWMATGKVYAVGKGGGRPQPEKPNSRHRPKPIRRPTEVEKPREVARPEPLPPPVVPVTAEPESVSQFLQRGGRIQNLPSPAYEPPALRPVREVYRGRGGW